jgi:hypothetical protein
MDDDCNLFVFPATLDEPGSRKGKFEKIISLNVL